MENEKVICKPAIGYLHRPDRGLVENKKGAKEMKLYAIRDKKTGWLLDYCQASDGHQDAHRAARKIVLGGGEHR